MLIYIVSIALASAALTYHITSGTEAGSEVEVTENGETRIEWNTFHGEHDGSVGPLWVFAIMRRLILHDHDELIAADWWQNPQSKRRALLLHLRYGITCPYCVSFTLSVIIAAIAHPAEWFLVGLASAGLVTVGLKVNEKIDSSVDSIRYALVFSRVRSDRRERQELHDTPRHDNASG